MGVVLCCVLALMTGQIRGAGRSGDVGNVRTSWISGRVHTSTGDPIPVSMIAITLTEFENGRSPDWPGVVDHVKPNGVYRFQVPSDATYEVCASVPGKQRQCKQVRVEGQDLGVADFEF